MTPYAGGTIGLVGRGTLPGSFVESLRSGKLSSCKFVDATDMVDQIKVIKSDEEIGHIRRTAAVQDAAMSAAMKAVAPGKREIEIAAIAEHYVLDHGGEQGLFLCCSHAPGQPTYWGNRHLQNRTLNPGDMFTLLIESNGPGGFYTEISRTCVLGQDDSSYERRVRLPARGAPAYLGSVETGDLVQEHLGRSQRVHAQVW